MKSSLIVISLLTLSFLGCQGENKVENSNLPYDTNYPSGRRAMVEETLKTKEIFPVPDSFDYKFIVRTKEGDIVFVEIGPYRTIRGTFTIFHNKEQKPIELEKPL